MIWEVLKNVTTNYLHGNMPTYLNLLYIPFFQLLSAILLIFQIIICKNMANKTPVQKVHMNYPNSGQAHEKSFTQIIELNTFTLL